MSKPKQTDEQKPETQQPPQMLRKPKIAPDRLRLQEIYPDKTKLLMLPRRLSEIHKDCIFALDASCLISPFDTGQEATDGYETILKRLVKAKRVLVPTQAMREYVNRRGKKIADIHSSLQQRYNKAGTLSEIDDRVFKSHPIHSEVDKKRDATNKLLKQYKEELKKLIDEVGDWNWNDPITKMYSKIFQEEHFYDCDVEDIDLQNDFKRRNYDQIPPAGEDASKAEGIGDIVIWHTMLRMGQEFQKPIVFVSNEKKSDWMQNGAKAIAVRFELLYEFKHKTAQDFGICDFSEFLAINGATEQVVSDAKIVVSFQKEVKVLSGARSVHALRQRLQTIRDSVTSVLYDMVSGHLTFNSPWILRNASSDVENDLNSLVNSSHLVADDIINSVLNLIRLLKEFAFIVVKWPDQGDKQVTAELPDSVKIFSTMKKLILSAIRDLLDELPGKYDDIR